MYKTCGQDNIASKSIQTYDDMETFELDVVNEKQIQVVYEKKFKLIVVNK